MQINLSTVTPMMHNLLNFLSVPHSGGQDLLFFLSILYESHLSLEILILKYKYMENLQESSLHCDYFLKSFTLNRVFSV